MKTLHKILKIKKKKKRTYDYGKIIKFMIHAKFQQFLFFFFYLV